MSKPDVLADLINEFVGRLHDAVRQQALEAVQESLMGGTNGTKAHAATRVHTNGANGKGQKRDPEALDALHREAPRVADRADQQGAGDVDEGPRAADSEVDRGEGDSRRGSEEGD